MTKREKNIITKEDTEGIDLRFGNADAMIEMVHKIANRKGKLGEIGALGSAKAAQKIGKKSSKFLTTIKGLETIACDPRTAKGFGFAYAVASRGSDHLRAHPVFEMIKLPGEIGEKMFGSPESCDLTKYGGKVNMILWHENFSAITDSIGTCRFMHASYYAQYPIPELMAEWKAKRKGKKVKKVNSIKYHEWISAATGMDIDYDKLQEIGNRIINLERAINVKFGIRRKDDTLPDRFLNEPLPSGPAKGETFPKKQLDSMIDDYYKSRGWDKTTGLPLKRNLLKLGMIDVADDLENRKLLK